MIPWSYLLKSLKEKALIELSYKELRNPQFCQALGKLASSGAIHDPRTLLNVALIFKAVKAHWIQTDKEWPKIVEQYRAEDQTGTDNPEEIAIDDSKKDDFETTAQEWLDTKAFVKRPHLSPLLIAGAGLSPVELIALEPLLNMSEEA